MRYKGFLIDLDGTAYLGSKKIETATMFVNKLVEKNIPFLFVSNNSSKSKEDVAKKLKSFGYNINESNIFTSANATKMYFDEHYPNKNCYVIGDEGLKSEINASKINLFTKDNIKENSQIDVVLVGYDNKVTYQDLANACLFVRKGAILVSTNPDIALPSEKGLLPGNGALTSFIEVATKTYALYIGKPSNIIMDYATEIINIDKTDLAMIGDNYDTDIMSGINAGIDTIYVETGLTTLSEVLSKKIQPNVLIKDLSEYTDI